MAATEGTMKLIDDQIEMMQRLKSQLMQGAQQNLPPNVGLIYLPHKKDCDAFVQETWGDAQKKRAWVRCSQCGVHYYAHLDPENCSGKYFRTKTPCPSCGGRYM